MDQLLDLITESINKLLTWIDHSYLGWDPYDGLNSVRFKNFQKCPKLCKIAIIQANKVSPINFRLIYNVDPGIDIKGISIFLQAYANLFASGMPGPFNEDGQFIFTRLFKENIQDDRSISWSSHYFNYIGVQGSMLTPSTPDLIGSSNAMKAICQYSELKEIDVNRIIEKYYNYLIDNFDYDHECFTYGYYMKNKYVPNCDAEVISSYRYTRRIVEDDRIHEICRISLNKLIDYQNDDGSWFYSYFHDGSIYKQLDFHQGFIINGLIDAKSIYPTMEREISTTLTRAVDSYNSLFSTEGRCHYRHPRRYPTDIHNQAQGIITYSKLYDVFKDKKFYDKLKLICKWTIKNMQDPDGYFYYQKGRFLANKIPYLRWSQAWMMLALSDVYSSFELSTS